MNNIDIYLFINIIFIYMKRAKVINISEKTHSLIKGFCSRNGLLMGKWAEDTLLSVIYEKTKSKKNAISK